jgi:hypothetical protein
LPPPAPGRVRVYRGQTKDYATLLPSGLRQSIRNRTIWELYCQHLHADFLAQMQVAGDGMDETLAAVGMWLHAVAQHYGPGSDFTDVTYSLDTALWFALHELEEVTVEGCIGPPGPPDPAKDHPTLNKMYRHRPWSGQAYLYVMDLPKWDGKGRAKPGTVVDLADAPVEFSSSPRMHAQQGCLVYCRNEDSSPLDLKQHLVPGTPLVIAAPLPGTPGVDRTTADMFPSPEVDEWYARLLSVPMAYAPTPQGPRLRRCIPVAAYMDQRNDQYTQEVLYRDVCLPLPLVHRAFADFDPSKKSLMPANFSPPVAIILEAPMVFPTPSGDSDMWHHGLLATDLADACPFFDFGSDTPVGQVPLNNVLFEFSFLENTGWERIVEQHLKIRTLRGIWLRRDGEHMAVAFLQHEIPGANPEVEGFFRLQLDAQSERWVFAHPSNGSVFPIADSASLAKPILIALKLLRHLSSPLKVEASPRLITAAGDERTIMLDCGGAGMRLFRVKSPYCDWYVARDYLKPEEPFTHLTNTADVITIKTTKRFCDVPTATLLEHIRKCKEKPPVGQ